MKCKGKSYLDQKKYRETHRRMEIFRIIQIQLNAGLRSPLQTSKPLLPNLVGEAGVRYPATKHYGEALHPAESRREPVGEPHYLPRQGQRTYTES